MYANPTDFDKYSDDFYIKELKRNPEALAVAEASTRALKNFVVKPNCCRRAEILKFFNEEVSSSSSSSDERSEDEVRSEERSDALE